MKNRIVKTVIAASVLSCLWNCGDDSSNSTDGGLFGAESSASQVIPIVDPLTGDTVPSTPVIDPNTGDTSYVPVPASSQTFNPGTEGSSGSMPIVGSSDSGLGNSSAFVPGSSAVIPGSSDSNPGIDPVASSSSAEPVKTTGNPEED
ncbi:MAG: hypothetical protein HUK21_03870, partial [Fibrobacteraceae bacterium]|nr:hypothetical protein [Fibrobacteraceae bacterium]